MIEYIQTCNTISQVPPGARIISIDDIDVISYCEICVKPILETDEWTLLPDCIFGHKECYKE